jgi:hypothetical protein
MIAQNKALFITFLILVENEGKGSQLKKSERARPNRHCASLIIDQLISNVLHARLNIDEIMFHLKKRITKK